LVEEFAVHKDKYLKMLACIVGYALMAALAAVFSHEHAEDEESIHDHDH
jgi:hypothetical protein